MAATRPSVRVASSGPVRRRRERGRLAGWGRSHVGSGGGWLLVESRATKLPRQLTLGGSGRFMGGVDYSAAWGPPTPPGFCERALFGRSTKLNKLRLDNIRVAVKYTCTDQQQYT